MSDESEIAQVLAGIGRLKLGKMSTALLAGIAIWKWCRGAMPPARRALRWALAVVGGIGIGYLARLLQLSGFDERIVRVIQGQDASVRMNCPLFVF
jgi:hypothetical protein